MEVILLEHVDRLGKMGEKVTVKNGYARNYLLPQKKALRATEANLAVYEQQKKELEAHNKQLFETATQLAESLKGFSGLTIPAAEKRAAAVSVFRLQNTLPKKTVLRCTPK